MIIVIFINVLTIFSVIHWVCEKVTVYLVVSH